MEKRALGKGLSALLPEKNNAENDDIRQIEIDRIKNNSLQPRSDYNDERLQELINSIKEKGVLQPILVRRQNDGFEVIAGERRLRAVRALNLPQIPAVVKSVTDQEALVIALVENIQREELNPMEEAEAYKKLIEEFQYTHDAVAAAVGKDRSTITNLLRLLKHPAEIQRSIYQGDLSIGHARALLGIEPLPERKRLAEKVLEDGLSVRELEKIVREGFVEKRPNENRAPRKDHELLYLEDDLQKVLGTKVHIVSKKKKGKLVIEYYSLEDLDRIITKIKQ